MKKIWLELPYHEAEGNRAEGEVVSWQRIQIKVIWRGGGGTYVQNPEEGGWEEYGRMFRSASNEGLCIF